jgi:hypothetical protein
MKKEQKISEIKQDFEDFVQQSTLKEMPYHKIGIFRKEEGEEASKEVLGKKFAEADKDISFGGYDVHEFYTTCNDGCIYAIKQSHQSMNPFHGEKGRLIKRNHIEEALLKAIGCFYDVKINTDKEVLFKRKAVGNTDTGKDYYQVLVSGKRTVKIRPSEREKLREHLRKSLEEALD